MRKIVKVALTVMVLVVTLSMVGHAQTSQTAQIKHLDDTSAKARIGPIHGTVNVFLANNNGLVVVTDSGLSDEVHIVDNGQKLFKVDDHTICSIAGWYADPGPVIKPEVSTNPSYPAYLAVPQIMQTYISAVDLSSDSMENKIQLLSKVFASSLLSIVYVNNAAGISSNVSKSEITVAGYDNNGIIEILQADLNPNIQNGKIEKYDIVRKPTIYVSEASGFVPVIRGHDSIAQLILNGSYPSMDRDPILGYFKTSLASDRGSTLSLEDMEQIAKQIERLTAQHDPFVGGRQQIAELSAGQVSEFSQPISKPYPNQWRLALKIENIGFMGHDLAALRSNPPFVYLAQNVPIYDMDQPLDGIFFFKSKLIHCRLTYKGFPSSILDKSNTVVDSTLTLLPGADPNSNFVKQIRIDFPTLTIINQTGINH
jgi:hypothetical protein